MTFGLKEFMDTLNGIPYFWKLLAILVIWTVVLILAKHFDKLIQGIADKSDAVSIDKRALKSLDTVLDICFYIGGIFATLYALGISEMLYAAMTAFGVMGIVIGFAAKDIISNMFSGLFMVIDQPFLEGDYVEIGQYSGTVKKMSIRSTELEMADGVWLTLPNSILATKPILNYTMATNRRAEIKVSLLYKDDVDLALKILRELSSKDPRILQDMTIQAIIADVQEYRTILQLRFWVPKSDLMEAKSDMYKAVTKAFKEKGIELAMPLRRNI